MPSLTLEAYNKIKEKYGYTSSWAVWSEQNIHSKSGMDDISFFENPNISILNPNIILVGLNISEKIERIFGNFHPDKKSAQDYKTRYAIHNTMFWGAYMTDIIKKEEKISGNLMKYLSANKEFVKENLRLFEQEIIDIDSQNTIIVAFGNDSYNILKPLEEKYKIYKVPHYSAFISLDFLRMKFIELEIKIRSSSQREEHI
jgi:hypothetical protein